MEIECTVKEALQYLKDLDENSSVILTINDTKKIKHKKPIRIKVIGGKCMIEKSNKILYQDNDYFGRLSLYGVTKNPNVVHNLLFPQISKHLFDL